VTGRELGGGKPGGYLIVWVVNCRETPGNFTRGIEKEGESLEGGKRGKVHWHLLLDSLSFFPVYGFHLRKRKN